MPLPFLVALRDLNIKACDVLPINFYGLAFAFKVTVAGRWPVGDTPFLRVCELDALEASRTRFPLSMESR